MKITQITTTVIEAEEGKLLCRKSDGQVVGEKVHLGYNYYEAGLPLAEAKLETPDDYEEIDKPVTLGGEEEEVQPKVDHVRRLKRMSAIVSQTKKDINTLGLTAKEALEVVEWFPEFGKDEGYKIGDYLARNKKFQYEGKLYAVVQDHTILTYYFPSEETKGLYTEVTEDYVDYVEENTTDYVNEY